MSYKCMNCKGTFDDTSHARACYASIKAAAPANVPHVTFEKAEWPNADRRARLSITTNQWSTINRMAQERGVTHQVPRNMLEASRLIHALGLHNRAPSPSLAALTPQPTTPPAGVTPTPVEPPYEAFAKVMLDKIPDGRYGVTADSGKQTIFMAKRTFSPTAKNRYAGSTVVRVRSGDTWYDTFIYWPSGQVSVRRKEWQGTLINDALAIIFTDIGGSAQLYADRYSECSNCGKELTDDRSRYFGLGSDCIKRRTDIVNYVVNNKGPYTPGAASQSA